MPITQRLVTPVTFHVPAAINLKDFFREDDCDCAAFLFDTVLHRMLAWQQNEKGFVHLAYKLLTHFIPVRRFVNIRSIAEEHGLIELHPSYSVGRYSKGYRLPLKVLQSREVVCHDRRLAGLINRYNLECQARLQPVHRWLEGKLGWLQFDQQAALAIITSMAPDADSPLDEITYRLLISEGCKRFSPARITKLSVDKYGRFHSPLTSMPSKLRTCMSVNGQHLIGIDLVNSQPLIAAIVAESCLSSMQERNRLITRKFGNRRSPYMRKELMKIQEQHKNEQQLPIMCCASGSMAAEHGTFTKQHAPLVIPSDLDDYKAQCVAGTFYESLMEQNNETAEHRKQVKRQLFRDVFFGEERFRSPLKSRFVAKYPTMAGVLSDLKSVRFQQAARLMQCFESSFFIDIVCRRIMRERREIPIYTIHDSILTTAEHEEYVSGVILDEFAKIGVAPRLKREQY